MNDKYIRQREPAHVAVRRFPQVLEVTRLPAVPHRPAAVSSIVVAIPIGTYLIEVIILAANIEFSYLNHRGRGCCCEGILIPFNLHRSTFLDALDKP